MADSRKLLLESATNINDKECSSLLKSKILIVEDHSHIRQVLVLRLNELGYTVFEAETGLDAFRLAREIPPDLILMDLGLPGISGDEVMAWLKTDLVTRHIPIVSDYSTYNRYVPRHKV